MISEALEPGAADTPLSRFCTLLDQRGLLDRAQFALPGDTGERARLLALREAIPEAVNHRVALARQHLPDEVSKTAGDFIAPFEQFDEMVSACRAACASRSLDLAIWGHISDGNIHPNVIPRLAGDVARGREALLEAGRAVIALAGSPLAEHGVGRNPVKQQFLRMVRGDEGVDAMWAVKRALDPAGILAPGVLFGRSSP
jgi:D-lactate dehydrogenase (cytochrome)